MRLVALTCAKSRSAAFVAKWKQALPDLKHDPDPEGRVGAKWAPVFLATKREAFARRSCAIKNLKRDGDST